MQQKKTFLYMIITGTMLVLISGLALMAVTPASAQCGSQASSCKSCHEVQAKKPVNGDGTPWHTSHAFGDFCYICHAGNNQAKDQDGAHTGMVSPLSDVKASCQQCHPSDLDARAKVYADKLGVDLSAAGAAPATSAPAANAQPAAAAPASGQSLSSTPQVTEINYDDPNLVNFVARYDEIVLGKKPVNWGNAILWALIIIVAAGGGLFVILREKLVKVTFGDTRVPDEGYSAEVVEMLPALSKLKPTSRTALKNVIANPKADKMLGLMDAIVSDEKSEE